MKTENRSNKPDLRKTETDISFQPASLSDDEKYDEYEESDEMDESEDDTFNSDITSSSLFVKCCNDFKARHGKFWFIVLMLLFALPSLAMTTILDFDVSNKRIKSLSKSFKGVFMELFKIHSIFMSVMAVMMFFSLLSVAFFAIAMIGVPSYEPEPLGLRIASAVFVLFGGVVSINMFYGFFSFAYLFLDLIKTNVSKIFRIRL